MNLNTHIRIALVAVVCILSSLDSSLAKELVHNGDFKHSHVTENLWDGINKDNELQLGVAIARTLISGSIPGNLHLGISIVFKDVTGDGKPDLVAAGGGGFIWIYELASRKNSYPLKFKPARFLHEFYDDIVGIDVVDMNADGMNDILIGKADGMITWIRNLGEGKFVVPKQPTTMETSLFDLTVPRYRGRILCPRLYDWTGNRKRDLIFGEGSYSANAIYLYLNQGNNSNPSFDSARRDWLAYGMGREQLAPAIGDLDADGDPDLLVGERVGNLTWYENTGPTGNTDTPYLTTIKSPVTVGGSLIPAGQCVRPYLADVDGDKDLDLFLGSSDGRILLSRNIGSRAEPNFAKALPLTGRDTLKPYTTPNNWFFGGNYGNDAIKCTVESDTDIDSGRTFNYAHVEYIDKYVGRFYASKFDRADVRGNGISVRNILIDYNRTYTVTFRARGNIKTGFAVHQAGESYIEGEFKKSVQGKHKNFPVSVTPEWQTFSFNFSFSPLTQQDNKSNKTSVSIGCSVSSPNPNAYFDLADVEVRPAE
jgi:hypothetical protein